jgi:paired amphipathic helix protein Sin3a
LDSQRLSRDAFAYLDAVKSTFSEDPDTYNTFLDIMKAHGAKILDTPGVIREVAQLFAGKADLLSGLNQFLLTDE